MRKFLSLLLTMAMVLSLAVTVNAAAPKEDHSAHQRCSLRL